MIELHRSTPSTNDLALEAAEEGAPHGACWVADRQTAGRGSRELGGERREWFSPAGSNIYMSLLLRPDLPPAAATHMTLAAAVGAADAVVEQTGTDVWIKWPNDLYLGDRKLAGILTEADTDDGQLRAVVVGIGLNVNVEADAIPDELADLMTSLQIATGGVLDRMPLVFALRDSILEECESFARSGLGAVIDDVQAYDRTDGRDVRVRQKEGWRKGVARGVDERGHLQVDVGDETLEVQAGEVEFL